jgi:hypothetical protein
MLNGLFLDSIPEMAVYILSTLLFLTAMELGYQLGKTMNRKSPAKSDAGEGTIVAATLALLAFILAFVVSSALGIFTERRQLVIQEANAIGTTYLRAGYLDEPYRTESRDLLRKYVDLRLAALDPAKLEMAITRSEQIHNELWKSAETIARESPSETIALYISSLNEVIDLHTERINVGLVIRVPPVVIFGMYLVALLTLFLAGMQSGYAENRNLIAQIILVLVLSIVFLLIIDLDRSSQGLLQVPQQALINLQRQLNP